MLAEGTYIAMRISQFCRKESSGKRRKYLTGWLSRSFEKSPRREKSSRVWERIPISASWTALDRLMPFGPPGVF